MLTYAGQRAVTLLIATTSILGLHPFQVPFFLAELRYLFILRVPDLLFRRYQKDRAIHYCEVYALITLRW